MRCLGLIYSTIFFISLPLAAQTPPPNGPAPSSSERLDGLLKACEARMATIKGLTVQVSRTETHPLTKKQTIYVGEAAFMKPNLMRLDLTHHDEVNEKDAQKTNFERLICDGQRIYEYAPKDKLIIVHDMPKGGNLADDNLVLGFLTGMKAVAAKQRFDLVLEKDVERENGWYWHVRITPKSDADRREFTLAELVIWAKNPNPAGQPDIALLPYRVWFRAPNGKEVIYLLEKMQPNAKLTKESFAMTKIEGYKQTFSTPAAPPSPALKPAFQESKP